MNANGGIGRWIAPIIVIVIVLLSFSKILFHDDYVLVEGQDLTGQAYPWFNAAAYWFQNRTLLLWDPYVFSGKPNVGEPQTGMFYPINWIFFAWPFENGQLPPEALETLVVLNFCLMSLFMYFLARTLGISKRGAIIAGIVGGLGGLSSKMHSWLNIQSSFVWLPLVLLFYYKAVKTSPRKIGYAFLFLSAICLAISFLAGHHQPPIQAAILLGLFAIYLKTTKQHSTERVPLFLGLLIVGALAALIAAVQILPSAEWGSLAYRWAGQYGPVEGKEKIPYYILENIEKIHPQDFLSIVIPYATTMVNLYVGPLVILLAAAGAIFSTRKEARFFLIAAVLFLLFSLGKYSILHTLLYTYVPGVWFAREAIYYLLPFLICIALLAGYGLDAFVEGLTDPSNNSIRIFNAFMIQLIGIILALFFAFIAAAVLQDDHVLREPKIIKLTRLSLYLVLICILLAFLHFRKISTPVFQTLLMLIVVIDLGSEISRAIPVARSDEEKVLTPASVYRNNELVDSIKKHQVGKFWRVDDLSEILPPNAGDAWLFDETLGYTTTMAQHYYDLRASGWGQFSNPSALLNTQYFISPAEIQWADSIYKKDDVGIYRNPRAVPKVFTTSRIKVFPEKEKLLEFMNSPLFNPHAVVLFLQKDWEMIPKEWQKKFNLESVNFDMSKVEVVKSETTPVVHSNPDTQHIYKTPWGWDSGDVMNGTFSLASDMEVSALFNYFPSETDCNLPFILRTNNLSKEESITLNAGTEQKLIQTKLDLGKLRSGEHQFQITIPDQCGSRLDSIEIISNDFKPSDSNEIKILSNKPHEIRISTSSETSNLLILSEVFYPGWVAEMDGKKIPVYRVDYALMGVGIEAGKHTVEFHFRPSSVYLGLAVTVVTLMAVIFYLWLQRKNLIMPQKQTVDD
jgi:hypothetical protein